MSAEEFPLGEESEDLRKVGVPCPFCEYGVLVKSARGNYLVCDGCHRKVYEALVSLPRLRLLLDAFDKLRNYSYDDELNHYADYVASQMSAELKARSVAWSSDDTRRPEPVPDLVIPPSWPKASKLSDTALAALNQLRQDHEFDEGPNYLDEVLDILRHLTKRTASQGRLRRQLEAISYDARQSLSRALAETG